MIVTFRNNGRFLREEIADWLRARLNENEWVFIRKDTMGIIDKDIAMWFWIIWS